MTKFQIPRIKFQTKNSRFQNPNSKQIEKFGNLEFGNWYLAFSLLHPHQKVNNFKTLFVLTARPRRTI